MGNTDLPVKQKFHLLRACQLIELDVHETFIDNVVWKRVKCTTGFLYKVHIILKQTTWKGK
jgi:hypothetical protein